MNKNYLLDTHIFIWAVAEPTKLTEVEKNIIYNGSNNIYISSISVLEIAQLIHKNKISLTQDLEHWIAQASNFLDLKSIQVSNDIARLAYIKNLVPHEDPADRIISATAMFFDYILISRDKFMNGSSYFKSLII